MPSDALDLVKGTVDVLLLRALAGEPMHGYAITEWIHDRSAGSLEVRDAALYQALHRLERKGYVDAVWGLSENNRRARYYSLTAAGRQRLRVETSSWWSYVEAVSQVLGPRAGEFG